VSEFHGRRLLGALFHATRVACDAPDPRPGPEAVSGLRDAAGSLAAGHGEAVLAVVDDAFFLDGEMLPHASVEYRTLLRWLQDAGIESIVFAGPPDPDDLQDLAALAAGRPAALREGATVLVNEREPQPWELRRRPTSALRSGYWAALDLLRSIAGGGGIDIGAAGEVVDGFLAAGDEDVGACLLLAATENRSEIIAYHSVNVCLLSLALGRHLGLDETALRLLGIGALLHDVGRFFLGDDTAEKQERLSSGDWSRIRLHPQEGATGVLAAARPGEEVLARIVLEHHVRLDGGGYPDLGGAHPPPLAQVVALADAYDALTSERPHRSARAPREALRLLLDGAGTVHDGALVQALVDMTGMYPPGSLVRLRSGEVAAVVPAPAGRVRAVVVRDAGGHPVEGGAPAGLERDDVVGNVLPAEVGVDPAALLEQVLEGTATG
jgi:HD-GYP domain-containing protein (c-di-GMP phosphodiesterase class II)